MKWLNVIFSIYLVALACLPCADMETDCQNTATTKSVTADNHDNSSQHNDLCSPFCICNCCGAQVLNFAPPISFTFTILPDLISTSEIAYKPLFTSTFTGSIWQPPQLV
ncbi:MAG TPA: DUF6660 family protein [Flavobacterium sp.]|nr:DUF6660 family protein [Flavobacterium sp.]